MAIIQCPKCKREISSTSEKCGYCGHQIKSTHVYEAEEIDKDDKRTEYLILGIKILLGALILLGLIFTFIHIKRSHRESIENAIEFQKTSTETPNTLIIRAKAFYREGKFANAQLIIDKIISEYQDSDLINEALKLKITVDSALKIRRAQEKLENDRRVKLLLEDEKKREIELRNLYERDVIQYFKNIYGKPDNETDYVDEYIKLKTLIWNCAGGKYRSIDFEYKNGKWWKKSEYTSDCI